MKSKTIVTGCLALWSAIFPAAPAWSRNVQRDIPIMIQTSPATPGVQFSLDGRLFATNGNGLALITVGQPGTYDLRWLPGAQARGARVELSTWSDGVTSPRRRVKIDTFTALGAGLNVYHEVAMSFADREGRPVEPSTVGTVLMTDDAGETHAIRGQGKQTLLGTRTAASQQRLKPKSVEYEVQRVLSDGIDIAAPQTPLLLPAQNPRLRIPVALPEPPAAPPAEGNTSFVIAASFIALFGVFIGDREKRSGGTMLPLWTPPYR